MMEYDIHTLLDLLTLAATIWVIYTMRTSLKARGGTVTYVYSVTAK
jgi:hypothetical protein